MSLLSTKSIYGLIAIFEIAHATQSSPLSIKDISEKTGISKNYLEQILNPLRISGIIQAQKGIKGGYYLCKSLEDITFLEIFTILETNFSLLPKDVEMGIYADFLEMQNNNLKDNFNKPLSQIYEYSKNKNKFINYTI